MPICGPGRCFRRESVPVCGPERFLRAEQEEVMRLAAATPLLPLEQGCASLALLCLAERLIIGPYLMTNLEA